VLTGLADSPAVPLLRPLGGGLGQGISHVPRDAAESAAEPAVAASMREQKNASRNVESPSPRDERGEQGVTTTAM
jgi:hypothetical protein